MPIFEYRCAGCGHRFEKLVRRPADADALKCPQCGHSELNRELSVFAAPPASTSKSAQMAGCPGGMCPNAGLCGRN